MISASPYRVLIVDDESSVRKAVKWMLYASEYSVSECENGLQAKTLLQQSDEFDVIICDVKMPYMNGIELLKYVKSNYHSEVIMLTGQATTDLVVEAIKAGAFDYLTKPLDAIQECISKIKQAAEVYRKNHTQYLQNLAKKANTVISKLPTSSKKGLIAKKQITENSMPSDDQDIEQANDHSPADMHQEHKTQHPLDKSKVYDPDSSDANHNLIPKDWNLTKAEWHFFRSHINLSLPFQAAVSPLEEKIRYYYLSHVLVQNPSISEAARKAEVERSNFKRLLKRYKVDF